MALTKAQLSLVTVATLGVAPGGYTAQLAAFNSQKEAAAFIATTGLLNEGTNAEFVNTVAGNLNNLATAEQKAAFLKAIDDGASRSDAAVDFANTLLVSNASIANVTKAIASTSTSMDLNALKAEITPSAQTVTFNTASGTGFSGDDLKANLGKAEIENGESKISADFTFELKNQANVFTDGPSGGIPASEIGEFTGAFLSPMLERAAAVQSDSAIYVKLLDGFALRDNFQPIERLATNGIGFSIDGVAVVVADKPEDGDQGAIYKAKNYVELKDAITARLAELASGQGLPAGADAATYAKLATFTVELGSNFSKANQAGDQVTGTELVIKDASGSTLVPEGFSTYGGIHPYPDLNSINELTNQAPSTSTQLISTNINAENVGYGSQGGTLNIAGQSASKKGIEEFKVTATKDVWFTRLESRDLANNQHLQEVLLQSGSNGYFRVGTQDKGASLVALVDEDFGNKGAGLVDVLKLDAAAASSTAVNAFISDKVIARNYNLKDTDANYKTDDVQVNYTLTGGNDVLQLKIDSEVVAYADTQVSIVAGSGNDLVHLQIDQGNSYGTTWLTNQQLNDNIKIDAASGNNIIWTEGAGNVRITTGGGNDTILADNSGKQQLTYGGTAANDAAMDKLIALGAGYTDVDGSGTFNATDTIGLNGLFVLNAASTELSDIVSNSDYATGGTAATGAQVFNTYKNTVQVTFKGFESKHIEIAYDKTKYTTNMQQINQAVKKAINEDATLSKLIVAKEFPGNVLVVESLIDGVRAAADLDITFVNPVNAAAPKPTAPGVLQTTTAEETAVAALVADTAVPYAAADLATLLNGTTDYYDATSNATAFVTADGAGNEILGAVSGAESDNVINAGAGNDVIVLGTGAESNDTVVLSGNFGKTTIVNFDSSAAPAVGNAADQLDFRSYFVNTKTAGVSQNITVSDKRGAAAAVADDEVTILNFSDLELGTASGIDTATTGFSNVTAAQLKVELAAAGVTGAAAAVSEHVFLIENDSTFGTANAGEYLVVTATTTAANGDLTNVSIVGTLDFGATLAGTVAVADFA